MEISAPLFILVWGLIGSISLNLGFYTLDKTELSNSVSPVVRFFFKLFLETALLLALPYGFLRSQEWNYQLHTRSYIWKVFGVISILIQITGIITSSSYIPSIFSIKLMLLSNLFHLLPNVNLFTLRYPLILAISSSPVVIFPQYSLLLFAVALSLAVGREHFLNSPRDAPGSQLDLSVIIELGFTPLLKIRFLQIELVFIYLYVGALFYMIEPVRGVRIASVVGSLVARVKEKKLAKFIEFAVGMVGAVLFQSFFRLTSFNQVMAFLCLAIAWLAILAMLRVSYDFGVLNFLVGNVVVGCTVSQFGLHGTTWLAYGASLLLYALYLKIDSFTLVHRPNQLPQVMLW